MYNVSMKKKIILLVSALSMVLSAAALYFHQTPKSDDHVHYHAGFRVYRDGVLQDYSGYQYMNYVPCSEHDAKKSSAEEQIEKAHLHDSVGDVVHVHRRGAMWGDLFININVELPEPVIGFVNGAKVEDIMNTPIESYSTAIIEAGTNTTSHEKEVVSVDYIKQVEAKSELCGTGE